MVCCVFVIFGWVVPSTIPLDALPGLSPKVCVLGLLTMLCAHVFCFISGIMLCAHVPCVCSFFLGCAPGNGSRGTSWAVPEGVRPGTLAMSVVLCYVVMCRGFFHFLVGCAPVDCS